MSVALTISEGTAVRKIDGRGREEEEAEESGEQECEPQGALEGNTEVEGEEETEKGEETAPADDEDERPRETGSKAFRDERPADDDKAGIGRADSQTRSRRRRIDMDRAIAPSSSMLKRRTGSK